LLVLVAIMGPTHHSLVSKLMFQAPQRKTQQQQQLHQQQWQRRHRRCWAVLPQHSVITRGQGQCNRLHQAGEQQIPNSCRHCSLLCCFLHLQHYLGLSVVLLATAEAAALWLPCEVDECEAVEIVCGSAIVD
jgi:hypothetical protein